MTEARTFSIVTVTLNNRAGFERTTRSLQRQDCTDYEWIVIDGGSTDGTDFSGLNAAIVSEPDAGIYDAMNKGLRRAAGQYVLFLNAGDSLYAPSTLETIRGKLENRPGFVYGDSVECAADGRSFYKPARPPDRAAWGMFTHHQAMLYRRDIVARLSYDLRYRVAADYKFTLEALSDATTLYIPEPLCLFAGGGLSQHQARQGRREQYAIRRKLAVVPPWKNGLIYALQTMAWAARQACPALYRTLKPRLSAGF